MPLRSMCWRCEGVRATCTLSIAIGIGAVAILGPPAYSPARKQGRGARISGREVGADDRKAVSVRQHQGLAQHGDEAEHDA
eukprot:656024-Pleurochrysis_carterae.AAC.1